MVCFFRLLLLDPVTAIQVDHCHVGHELCQVLGSLSPDPLTVTSGPVSVWIDNQDGARHTFTAPGLGIDVEVVGLKSQRVDFEARPVTTSSSAALWATRG